MNKLLVLAVVVIVIVFVAAALLKALAKPARTKEGAYHLKKSLFTANKYRPSKN